MTAEMQGLPDPLSESGIYRPLSEAAWEIRVLDLDSSDEYSALINCQLRTVSLIDIYEKGTRRGTTTENFEALSHTWGQAPKTQCILVNGHPVKVTSSLQTYLRVRREPYKEVLLWIDTICIHQQDQQERNFQVSIMNKIYATAHSLTIWLGEASDDSTLALNTLGWLGEGSPYDKMPLLDRRQLAAIDSILCRPWWTRVWIVQEVVAGGMGQKQQRMRVRCGEDSLLWNNIVVAAARIAAYAVDRRQRFPDVENILELDSLRERSYAMFFDEMNHRPIFDILCRYRHFDASDRRDKLYAIYSIASTILPKPFRFRYEDHVRGIYIDFAASALRDDQNMDILRQCGPTSSELRLPSWVPDWSVQPGFHSLPVRRIKRYHQVPWWANPTRTGSERYMLDGIIVDPADVRFYVDFPGGDRAAITGQHELALKRLEISATGHGVIRNFEEVPHDFAFHSIPEHIKNLMREMINREDVVFVVGDEGCLRTESTTYDAQAPDAVRQGEILTERQVKRRLLRELKDDGNHVNYQTSAGVSASYQFSQDHAMLQVRGIIWQTIHTLHEGFVEDVDKFWTNATRFMVDVGICKQMAMQHYKCIEQYPDIQRRLKAFWTTILAGDPENTSEGQLESCKHWLPEIPRHWRSRTPPTTPVTAGLVELQEITTVVEQVSASFATSQASIQAADNSRWSSRWLKSDDFNPDTWHTDEREEHEMQLKRAGEMWHEQPYDLYHRPFEFLHVVPDPYWHERQHEASIASNKATASRSRVICSLPPKQTIEGIDVKPMTLDELREFSTAVHKTLASKPSMVPQDTLEFGAEKYALGRKFFITRDGYMGIGPRDAQAGDTVAILFGTHVPFILRRSQDHSQKDCWRLLGEAYVDGAMKGEIVKGWQQGRIEATDVNLV